MQAPPKVLPNRKIVNNGEETLRAAKRVMEQMGVTSSHPSYKAAHVLASRWRGNPIEFEKKLSDHLKNSKN